MVVGYTKNSGLFYRKQKPMTTATSIQQSFPNDLLHLIKENFSPHSIYVISVNRKIHRKEQYLKPICKTIDHPVIYTLLVICKRFPNKKLGDLMDDLYNKTQKRFKVHAIVYSLSNARKCLDFWDNFLSKVIFSTCCIYKTDDTLDRFKNYPLLVHPNVYSDIHQVWQARMDRAEFLLSTVRDILPKEDPCAMLATMHFALEQICMGLLYVFWEFKPQHYALPYLLHLCSHFTELPDLIFSKDTYGSHRMHYMLCNAHHILRFKTKAEFSVRDSNKAFSRCDRFLDEAQQLGGVELERLKALHCASANIG